ncbi:hypothetical protein [Streptomyces hygroscopicus]|uniref:hypothetical protein n=1 Tax=Streptomyces hygroscopicus TaxID=1912 RepID=UPI00223FE771|nr:hypothetical protein [Streptomyces hygroscopicus]
MLPNVPIDSLLVEVDRHTGFPDSFTPTGDKQSRSAQPLNPTQLRSVYSSTGNRHA